MPWSERMDERALAAFRDMIRRRSVAKDGEPIPSTSAAQAAVIVETFFARAEKSVRILTGGLNARIYGSSPVIVEAKKFLASRNSLLEIVFLEEPTGNFLDTHPLLSALRLNRNVHLYAPKKGTSGQINFHFSIADDDMYRFKNDIGGHASITAFGDKEFAATLLVVFGRLVRVSRDLALTA